MNPRLAKDFRGLRLPWLLGLGLGVTAPLTSVTGGMDHLHLVNVLQNGAVQVIPGLLLLMAAMVFGVEFHYRTLSLLLSQPIPRLRIWREKHLVMAGTIVTVLLAWGTGWLLNQLLAPEHVNASARRASTVTREAAYLLLSLICTVGATGFWTLLSRSTIGGLAFNAVALVLVGGVLGFVLEKLSVGPEATHATFCVVGLFYTVLFQWLGWRWFRRWEVNDAWDGSAGARLDIPQRLRLDWVGLRCHPRQRVRNVVRKELRLFRSLAMIGGLFAVVWLVLIGLFYAAGEHREAWADAINILTACYVPLLLLLTGCISLGEERSMGVAAWQLTLPMSAARQWWIKLLVTVTAGLGIGLALPTLVTSLALPVGGVGLWGLWLAPDWGWLVALGVAGLLLIAGFWGVSLFHSTVHGALAAILICFGLGLAFAAGEGMGSVVGGLATPLFRLGIAHQQTPLHTMYLEPVWVLIVFFGLLIPLALRQSFLAFRRNPLPARTVAAFCGTLLGVSLAGGFTLADVLNSNRAADQQLLRELQNSLEEATLAAHPSGAGELELTPARLGESGLLSHSAKVWLRNSRIVTVRVATRPGQQERPGLIYFIATMTLPHGAASRVQYTVPSTAFRELDPDPTRD